MSNFLLNMLPLRDDRRLCALPDQLTSEYTARLEVLWDKSGLILGGCNGFAYGIASAELWEVSSQDDCLGASSSYTIQGQTQDGGGGPLGNVTVRAYLTADDTLQGQCVSNAGGWYYIGVPTNAAHYLIMTKAGSPNRGGMSVNTVIPT